MKLNIKYSLIIGCFFLFSGTSCKKNRNNIIPYVDVYISINVNNPSYFQLTSIGGWIYLNGGSKGIIAYRKSLDEVVAFDRHCPYDVEAGCTVVMDSSTVIATDPCSGSQFLITDGSVAQGPATLPLQQYNTSFDGQILQVYN